MVGAWRQPVPVYYWALPLLLMALLLSAVTHPIDVAIADWFYQPAKGFVWRHSTLLEQGLHRGVRTLALALPLVLALACWHTRRRPQQLRGYCYLLLCLLICAALPPPLKALTQQHCPWSLARYGGDEHYRPLLSTSKIPAHKPGRCWPGGHASIGFSLCCWFFYWRDRQPQRAWRALALAVAVGTVLSLGRMAQGAHFASHNLWTALLDWLVCLGLYSYMWRPQPTSLPISPSPARRFPVQ